MSRMKGDREISIKQIAKIIIYSAEGIFSRREIAQIVGVSRDTVWNYDKKVLLIRK